MPWKQCRALTRRCQAITRNHARLPRSGWRTRCWTPGTRDRSVTFRTQPGAEPAQSNQSPPLQRTSPNGCDPRPGPEQSGGRDVGFFQPGGKPCQRKSGRASPMTRASIPCICSRAGCRGASRGTPGAGWELVACLKRSGQTARIAAALLAQAKRFRVTGPRPGAFQGRAGGLPQKLNRQHRM